MLINYDKEELTAVNSRNYANIVETLHNQATCGTEENGLYKEVAIAERFSPAFYSCDKDKRQWHHRRQYISCARQ